MSTAITQRTPFDENTEILLYNFFTKLKGISIFPNGVNYLDSPLTHPLTETFFASLSEMDAPASRKLVDILTGGLGPHSLTPRQMSYRLTHNCKLLFQETTSENKTPQRALLCLIGKSIVENNTKPTTTTTKALTTTTLTKASTTTTLTKASTTTTLTKAPTTTTYVSRPPPPSAASSLLHDSSRASMIFRDTSSAMSTPSTASSPHIPLDCRISLLPSTASGGSLDFQYPVMYNASTPFTVEEKKEKGERKPLKTTSSKPSSDLGNPSSVSSCKGRSLPGKTTSSSKPSSSESKVDIDNPSSGERSFPKERNCSKPSSEGEQTARKRNLSLIDSLGEEPQKRFRLFVLHEAVDIFEKVCVSLKALFYDPGRVITLPDRTNIHFSVFEVNENILKPYYWKKDEDFLKLGFIINLIGEIDFQFQHGLRSFIIELFTKAIKILVKAIEKDTSLSYSQQVDIHTTALAVSERLLAPRELNN